MNRVLFFLFTMAMVFLSTCGKEPGKKPAPVTDQNTVQGVHVSCLCSMQYDPVCANGKTYGNTCMAQCEGITFWTPGACP